jgi:hypothetical protein
MNKGTAEIAESAEDDVRTAGVVSVSFSACSAPSAVKKEEAG